MSRLPLVVVVADVNNNLIDGSVIWLLNVVKSLDQHPRRGQLALLLREVRMPTSLLFPPALRFDHTEIIEPSVMEASNAISTLSSDGLCAALDRIEAARGAIDSILVRGASFATALMGSERYRGRTCVYLTERPRFASTTTTPLLSSVARLAKHVFVQSAAQQRYFEVYLQTPADKISVVPPMVDGGEIGVIEPIAKASVISYSGKLDSEYCIEELVDLAEQVGDSGFKIQVVGNKFNRDAKDPLFQERLLRKLESGEIDWIQGTAHIESKRLMARARFGFCMRSPGLDSSIELSTKLIEYCAAGTPPILRRTHQHEELLGPDYPFFADTLSDVVRIAQGHQKLTQEYSDVAARIRAIATSFDISKVCRRYDPLFPSFDDKQIQRRPAGTQTTRPTMLLATHDDKFLSAALRRLELRKSVILLRDDWANTHTRAVIEDAELERRGRADVVFCEWCCEQAVWWSHHKRPGQRLVVRLHRFEAFTPFPKRVNWAAVDHLIVVSEYFRDLAVNEFGAPAAIVTILPQYVDTEIFNRTKLPRADFTLGLVGINAFSHKRPDRAIELLERLMHHEPRFRLRIRSKMPWEFGWAWEGRPEEREQFISLFQRCLRPPLRERVLFDRAGSDMPEWFRGVSAIVSSSDTEGCHTSVAEGMASGCLPVCFAWPGAASVYGSAHVHTTVDGMADAAMAAIESMHSPHGRAEQIAQARRFDISKTVNYIESLLP